MAAVAVAIFFNPMTGEGGSIGLALVAVVAFIVAKFLGHGTGLAATMMLAAVWATIVQRLGLRPIWHVRDDGRVQELVDAVEQWAGRGACQHAGNALPGESSQSAAAHEGSRK